MKNVIFDITHEPNAVALGSLLGHHEISDKLALQILALSETQPEQVALVMLDSDFEVLEAFFDDLEYQILDNEEFKIEARKFYDNFIEKFEDIEQLAYFFEDILVGVDVVEKFKLSKYVSELLEMINQYDFNDKNDVEVLFLRATNTQKSLLQFFN